MPCPGARRWRRCVLASLLVLPLALGVRPHSIAQEASPQRDGEVPEPSACRVAPRSGAEVRALVGTSAPDEPSREVTLPNSVPIGVPAEPATRADITDAVREFVACLNTGEPLRYFALVSDDLLAALGPLEDESFEGLEAGATVPEEERASLLGVWNVQELDDGRVAATVAIGNVDDPHPAAGRTTIFLFERGDDRWLVDERIDEVAVGGVPTDVADIVGTPPSGETPTRKSARQDQGAAEVFPFS